MSLKISHGSFRNAHPDLWESAQTQFGKIEYDYIGETNDQEGKYFNLEEYEQEIYG